VSCTTQDGTEVAQIGEERRIGVGIWLVCLLVAVLVALVVLFIVVLAVSAMLLVVLVRCLNIFTTFCPLTGFEGNKSPVLTVGINSSRPMDCVGLVVLSGLNSGFVSWSRLTVCVVLVLVVLVGGVWCMCSCGSYW